ncbi:PH domain-containing protein [Gryllotalpicola reticulitermitis]|uniref:PH domain-containing protein n=1 Tax=Gryllotalpicola reticulitermitis TaxID=1184153 RepID=A0ABV8Q2N6_9MICO
MNESVVLRPRFGIVITCLVWAVVVVCCIALFVQGDGFGALRYLPLFLLAGYLCWMLFWSPAVRIGTAGVVLRNIARSRDVSWAAIRDVDTKYTLTLDTPAGRLSAWAAPAPSRFAGMRAAKAELGHLPESTYGPGNSVRLGDIPSSDSGLAALHVRRQWERLRDAGALTAAPLEGTGVTTHWHRVELIVLGALVLASVAAQSF